jgi:hypothetical protein
VNVEAFIPATVFNHLKARAHEIGQLGQYEVTGCATAVIIAPAILYPFVFGCEEPEVA